MTNRIVYFGILLALLLLSSVDARAQSRERTAWACGELARLGQAVGQTGNCAGTQQRWEIGALPTMLYAHCTAGSCSATTNYQNAAWRRWDDIPADGWVFGCPGPRAPGAWGVCVNERFYPKADIAVDAAPPSCGTRPADQTRTAQCTAPQSGSWQQIATHTCVGTAWTLGEFLPTTPPAGACVDPPPPPQITFTVLPASIRDGESVTLTWSATNSPMCHGAGSGWSGPELPPSGSRVVVPQREPQATQFQFQLSCDSLPGATGSAPASKRVVDLQVPFVPPAPPGCYPFITPGVVNHEQRAIDGLTVSAFGCDKPDGYVWRTVWRRGTLADVLANCGAAGMIAAIREQDIDAAWIACLTQPHTPATQVVAADLTARWKPRFVVAAATAGNRPVYTRNADGTRGARLTIAGVAQSIVVGVDCDGRRRLLGTTTRYHAVDGLRSTTDQVLPAHSYAVCSKADPPETGWPGF